MPGNQTARHFDSQRGVTRDFYQRGVVNHAKKCLGCVRHNFFEGTRSTIATGYLVAPGANDNAYPANQSNRNFHTVDVIATLYKPTEYADRTNNMLSDCAMNSSVLANSENIDRKDVVLYYRASVRDSTANNWALPGGGFAPQDSMVCKTVGPTLQMAGTFPVPDGDFRFFKDGVE